MSGRKFRPKKEPVDSWDQQHGETDYAFGIFNDYLHMGPQRTIAALALSRNTDIYNLYRMSGKSHWVSRSFDWDREQDRLFALEIMDERKKAAIQEVSLARKFLHKVSRRLEDIDPRVLTPDQLIKWFEVAVKIERLALGTPTEVIDIEERLVIRAQELGLDPQLVITQARQLVEEDQNQRRPPLLLPSRSA